ncbi:arylamine N-acetyltransferase [Alkalihalobacillus sp. AL-G]|uniref:arylamine N-acetyltransferase family protein n=1 Tax=Alkalihalobacillus sp. AL-G TaxID=2926399 RepID=UPI00272CBB8B|nr:arylamine N-acetyltransferase [Alkalihalobacillus sp. AL-G]WLD94664.1 arylamine N-acetyltransferase [Alkalihalobacillus sp. AL-G]
MTDLNRLFRKRIGYPENETITFEALKTVLEKAAVTIPFENLSIITKNTKEITRENLIEKLLVNNEGGLCYELNPLLYFFLVESGFDARLIRGEVFNNEKNAWSDLGRTHVAILLNHDGETYLIDSGFGGNLPLIPVPLTGEIVTSRNGEFRVKKEETDFGDFILEMKLKNKHSNWNIGYAFDSKHPVSHVCEFDEIQSILIHKEESPFNKRPLITQLTKNGNKTLTNTTFTKMVDGISTKEEIDSNGFNEYAKLHFGMEL